MRVMSGFVCFTWSSKRSGKPSVIGSPEGRVAGTVHAKEPSFTEAASAGKRARVSSPKVASERMTSAAPRVFQRRVIDSPAFAAAGTASNALATGRTFSSALAESGRLLSAPVATSEYVCERSGVTSTTPACSEAGRVIISPEEDSIRAFLPPKALHTSCASPPESISVGTVTRKTSRRSSSTATCTKAESRPPSPLARSTKKRVASSVTVAWPAEASPSSGNSVPV